MPTVTYSIKYRKNEGLVMSPEELTNLYFYGISTKSRDGFELSNDTIKMYIRAAQQEIEKFLEIRFNIQFVEENSTYYRDDYWGGFPIIKTKLPVNIPLSCEGFLNGIEQIKYPIQWLSTRKDSEGNYYKKINIVPTGNVTSSSSSDIILTGITAYLGLTSYGMVPNYFSIQYLTGFTYDQLPMEMVNLVGKLASIGLFAVLGDIILGSPGITGVSLGVDGLSQNIQTTMSAGNSGYSARIKQYTTDIDTSLKRLRLFYKSFNISSL